MTTSSPGALLVLLYDGLLRYVREAQSAMVAKDRARAGERIGRAQAILRELASTLNAQQSPELCARLQGLYLFCGGHLLRANIEQNPEKIAEVERLLAPLRDAWAQAVAKVASSAGK